MGEVVFCPETVSLGHALKSFFLGIVLAKEKRSYILLKNF